VEDFLRRLTRSDGGAAIDLYFKLRDLEDRLSDFVTGRELYPLTSLFGPFIEAHLSDLGGQMQGWVREALRLDRVRLRCACAGFGALMSGVVRGRRRGIVGGGRLHHVHAARPRRRQGARVCVPTPAWLNAR
jgi:hypothetical protein